IDSIAFVYARNDDVPPAWLERNAYRFYRPLTFASAPPADSVLLQVAGDIERALRVEPNMTNLWADLAMTRMRLNQPQPALDAMARACSIEPDRPLWRHRMGALAMQLGETDRAIEAFIALTKIDPGNATGFYNLAVALATKRQVESAQSAAERALEIDPNYAAAKELLRHLQTGE
ncbi:MAG: tetratricopeptide repeat protein, partial [Candidatus Latescibacterota bacterium]